MKEQNSVVNALVKAGEKIGKKDIKIKELKKENEGLILMLQGLKEMIKEEMLPKEKVVNYFDFYQDESGKKHIITNYEKKEEISNLIREVKGQEDE
jgi:hypothetical protein